MARIMAAKFCEVGEDGMSNLLKSLNAKLLRSCGVE